MPTAGDSEADPPRVPLCNMLFRSQAGGGDLAVSPRAHPGLTPTLLQEPAHQGAHRPARSVMAPAERGDALGNSEEETGTTTKKGGDYLKRGGFKGEAAGTTKYLEARALRLESIGSAIRGQYYVFCRRRVGRPHMVKIVLCLYCTCLGSQEDPQWYLILESGATWHTS